MKLKEQHLAEVMGSNFMTRRQALLAMGAMTAMAASAYALPGWALESSAWPLWSVGNGTGKIYLTGETPPRATAWKDQRIEKLILQCSTLWTETSQIHIQNPQQLIKQYGIDTGASLTSKLSKADQDRLTKVAALCAIPVDSIAQFRPWAAATILEDAYYSKMNLSESGTVEKVLIPIAKNAGIRQASEFPTNDDVVEFMGKMSLQEEVQFLQYTLDHILDGLEENERVYSLWSRGDLSGAEGMVKRMKESQPDLYKKHVVGRNQHWVPRIDKMLVEKKPVLIVVGLYHVVGPDGVLALLREHGLTVTLGG